MSRTTARFTHGATACAGITGLVYAYLRYFTEPADEFALVNHPAEPLIKNLHIVLSPLALIAFGLLIGSHIAPRLRSKQTRGRRSGLILLALMLPMAISGYVLQIGSDPTLRQAALWGHLLTSAVWLGTYLMHQFYRRPVPTHAGA